MIRILKFFLYLYINCIVANPFINNENEIFIFNADIKNNKIYLNVSAKPYHYLYKKAFKFESDNSKIILEQAMFPQPVLIDGETVAFTGNFNIIIPFKIQQNNLDSFNLEINYQGCLKDTLCYPPSKTSILLKLPNQIVKIKNKVTVFNDKDKAITLLSNAKTWPIIIGFFIFGLLLSFSPCMLPMLPIIFGIIVGSNSPNTTKHSAFLLALSYVLSMATTYMLVGVLVTTASLNLIAILQTPIINIIISGLFILFAIASFGCLAIKLPDFFLQRLNSLQQNLTGGKYINVIFMGVLSTLVVSPCLTAPLAGALTYLSSTGNILLGGFALFIMGFAMGIPILIFCTSASHFLPKAGPWMQEINIFFGVIFMSFALYFLARVLPETIILVLLGILLLSYALYLFMAKKSANFYKLWLIKKTCGFILGIAALILLNYAGFNAYNLSNTLNKNGFILIKDVSALKSNLANSKKITILDIYADWCSSCKKIEKYVFNNPKFKQKLATFNLLKIDITNYNKQKQQLMQDLTVFNAPTIIFYDVTGKEIKELRITSAVNQQKFQQIISKLESINCAKM